MCVQQRWNLPIMKLPSTPFGSAMLELSTSISWDVSSRSYPVTPQDTYIHMLSRLMYVCMYLYIDWCVLNNWSNDTAVKICDKGSTDPLDALGNHWNLEKHVWENRAEACQRSRVEECCNNSPMHWKPRVFKPVRGINRPRPNANAD